MYTRGSESLTEVVLVGGVFRYFVTIGIVMVRIRCYVYEHARVDLCQASFLYDCSWYRDRTELNRVRLLDLLRM